MTTKKKTTKKRTQIPSPNVSEEAAHLSRIIFGLAVVLQVSPDALADAVLDHKFQDFSHKFTLAVTTKLAAKVMQNL